MYRYKMDNRPEKKKSSRWTIVLLDIWLLLGLVLGNLIHDHILFILVCVFGSLLTITHMILALK